MNFNILIVDDEYYICEGIRSILENSRIPEIGEIRTCHSSEEALELCQTYKPQIVLTDIKMAEIDGVELIRRLNKILYPVRFLVLSGYDDYEFVRSAFQSGAVDYMLKPVIPDQLEKQIRNQVQHLKQDYFYEVNPVSRTETITLSRHLFTEIMQQESNTGVLSSEDELRTHLPHSYYRFYMIGFREEESTPVYNIINYIYDYLDGHRLGPFLCADLSKGKIVLLINYVQEPPNLAELWKTLQDDSDKLFRTKVSIGISKCGGYASLSALYLEAENRLSQRLTEGYGKIFDHDLPAASAKHPRKINQLVTSLFRNPELLDNGNLWEQLCEQLPKLNITDLKHFYSYFTGLLRCNFADFGISEHSRQFPAFYDFTDYTELISSIRQNFEIFASHYPKESKRQMNIEYIKEYIDNNFTTNITLKEVANLHFISPSHLSKLFRAKYSMTFQEYIIYRRMTYAEHLLHDPILSIQEIASMTGYDNAFNFSRAFKNYFGISPSHYRKQ